MTHDSLWTRKHALQLGLSLTLLVGAACGGGDGGSMPSDLGPDAGSGPADEEPLSCADVDCGAHGSCVAATLACDCEPGYGGAGCMLLPPQSSLVLWLDAADPQGDGSAPKAGTLATWIDKVGGLAFSSEADKQPSTEVVDGVSLVAFDGIDDYLTVAGFDALCEKERYTIVVVADAGAPTQAILAGVHPEAGHALLVESEDDDALRFVHRWNYGPSGGNDHSTKPGTFGAGLDLALIELDTIDYEVKIMSPGDGSLTANTDPSPFPAEAFDLVLGKLSLTQSSRYLDGSIAEILIYDGQLSPQEMEVLSLYMRGKYPALMPQ